MPKISRRKQSKPQHICGDEEDKKETEGSNGPVGKDAVEDNNANIVVTEDEKEDETNNEDNDENNDESKDSTDDSADIIPLQMEAEEEEDESLLHIDEDEDNFDEDSNHSHNLSNSMDRSDSSYVSQSSTPVQNDRMCDFCGVVKKSPSDLARHLLKHTGEHPFKCDHCDKAFKSKRSLQHHQRVHHGISLSVSMVAIDASIPLNRKRKSDEAVGCQSSPENEVKKIKQEVPDLYGYPSLVYSGEHQPLFMSETSCSSIGNFKNSQSLVKIEEGNNKTCMVCGKTCSKPSDLKRHMMSHTGERPFTCNICGKAFRAKNSMFYHQKSSHGLNIELSPGLQERFMKLKKQTRLKNVDSPNSHLQNDLQNQEMQSNDPQLASSLLLKKLGQKVRSANNSVLYSYDINTHQEGEVELDENTGLFKQSGSIFNKPLVTKNCLKPEPLKQTHSMVGRQIVQESHKVKRHICVKNETILVTRLDGVDVLTAKDVSMYKCYLCGKLFDDLLKIQCHLSMHFQRDLTLYRCQVCDDTFWFKFRVINHIRKNHPKDTKIALEKFKKEEEEKELKEKEAINVDEEDTDENKDAIEEEKNNETLSENNEKDKEMENSEKTEEETEDEVLSDGDEKVKADEMETEKDTNEIKEEETSENDSSENKQVEKPDDMEKSNEVNESGDIESNGKDKNEKVSVDNEKDEQGMKTDEYKNRNETATEATSKMADENPNVAKTEDSTSESTKDNTAMNLYDSSNKVIKSDPFAELYKGIRFRKKPNGSFICLLCRKSFYKEAALLQHIKIHDQQLICYCEECGDGFTDYGKLRVHITTDHKNGNENVSSSAAAKNTLLSSLLSKTSQWHKPAPVVKLPLANDKHLEKAREILKQEGIHDDITVVMPSEPDEENSTEARKANLDSILSQTAEKEESNQIQISPKRLLMSKLLSKSKRKSTQPIKIENTVDQEFTITENGTTPEPVERETIQVKQEPVEAKELSAPAPAAPVQPQNPVINSELMAAKLNNLALLHPGLHPVVMANTLATLAAQGMSVTAQGMLIPGKILPTIPMVGIPPATLAANASSFQALTSQLQQPITIPQAMNIPVSVNIPHAKEDTQPVVVKQEPNSPVEENNASNHSHSSNDQSPNQSDESETGTGEKENLVGLPRVQWSGPESERPPIGNPRNLPSSLQAAWNFHTADGRKVTSLSRTHSRLPVVSTPVDREKVCKPTVLADGRTVYRCPFCNKDFLSYSDINRHMDFHEDIRPFKCKYCEYYARTNSQLKVHMMRHQGIREFCCKLCNYKGVTQSDLNRHMKSQIHLLKAKHACPHCDEGFVTLRNLHRHLDGNCIVKMQKMENGEEV